jgi:hypothetical protein
MVCYLTVVLAGDPGDHCRWSLRLMEFLGVLIVLVLALLDFGVTFLAVEHSACE